MTAITTPLAFPLWVLYCFQPPCYGNHISRLLFILLVVILWLLHLDVKWLLICYCIESKNPREDQYSINHGFCACLRGHLANELTIGGIAAHHITHAVDI